jgi:hypothetical protein
MTEDEYRELQDAALEALRDLLRATEPGTGMYLHTAYAALKKEAEAGPAPTPNTTLWDRKPQWNEVLSRAERDREVVEILAEQRLTISDLTQHLEKKHCPDLEVWPSNVVVVVNRLHKARELDREPETWRKTRTRYRYFKRTALDGSIAALDRAFHEEAEAA